jgi:hypothetical protein
MNAATSLRGRAVLAATVGVSLAACTTAVAVARRSTDDADGIRAFVTSDFGGVSRATLRTAALPYKLVATGLVLREERTTGMRLTRADLPAIYRRYGFLLPARLGNWPASLPTPSFERPMGMISATVKGPSPLVRIEGVTLGCASCHAGPVYDANGRVTNMAWVGVPNTSLDLDSYSEAVYEGLKLAVADGGAARRRMVQLFPKTSRRERLTMRWFVLPQAARRLRALERAGAAPLPFRGGGPGLTNGVAALKHQLAYPLGDTLGGPEAGFTSIPDLSGRALRSSLLYDGVYTPVSADPFAPRDTSMPVATQLDALTEIVTFFTVPTMGMSPDEAEKRIPAVRPVVRWLGTEYHAPPFPGRVDSVLAREGAHLFRARCESCHGVYGEGMPRRLVSFPNRLVPQEQIGTDSTRWALIRPDVVQRLGTTAFGRHMQVRRTRGYVSPILSGVWATAPYLHNGSVPTLWALLTPGERPVRFLTGGHALDYAALGVALERGGDGVYRYPAGYTPWSTPQLFDTRLPGKSNRGHERQVAGLSAAEKRALIEYLKTL